MKKHTILALFFTLSLILTSVPINVYADEADGEIEEEIDGNDTLSEDDESSDDTSEGNEPNDNTEGEEESTINSGKCGDDLTWILNEDGTLTISGSGDMYDFTWMEDGNDDNDFYGDSEVRRDYVIHGFIVRRIC